jgi:hypothetical protein
LPRQVVVKLLPRGLEIAPQEIVPADQHPVLFVFGRQEHVQPVIRLGQGLDYLEFLVALPYLQWTENRFRYRGPFVYLPRLYLDHWLPVLLGWLCGLAKERAGMESWGEQDRIASLLAGTPLAWGSFKPLGQAAAPHDFPGFTVLRDIFSQPLVSVTPFGFMCLDFEWKLEQARLRPVQAEVRFEQPFLPGLPLEPLHMDGIDRRPGGAFNLDVPWTLSRPFLPSSLGVERALKSPFPRGPHFDARTRARGVNPSRQ